MSVWYESDGDFAIDYVNEEVDLLVTSNDQGNVYFSVSFDQIKEIHEKISELKSGHR